MRPDLPLEHDDVAVVIPTSGSSGQPKGVLLPAAALLHSAQVSMDRLGGHGQWVLALPVSHMGGMGVLVRSIVAGTSPEIVDLYGGFNPGAFASATARLRHDVPRYVSLVPTQLHRLLDAAVDLTTYDAILLGGAAAPQKLLTRAAEAGARVVMTFGMSETCGGCVYDGVPLAGVHVGLDEEERITIAGPVLFRGYRLRPDLTATALVGGQYVTSDLGTWREDGRLEIVGRIDDVIVSGAVKVSASRVEQVLTAHPGVRACVVVGRPDLEWGERVVAVIEPHAWDEVPTLPDLQALGVDELDSASLPRELVVLGSIPLLPSGKPDRVGVRNLVAASPAPSAANESR